MQGWVLPAATCLSHRPGSQGTVFWFFSEKKWLFVKLTTDVAVKALGAVQHTRPKVTPDVPEL